MLKKHYTMSKVHIASTAYYYYYYYWGGGHSTYNYMYMYAPPPPPFYSDDNKPKCWSEYSTVQYKNEYSPYKNTCSGTNRGLFHVRQLFILL